MFSVGARGGTRTLRALSSQITFWVAAVVVAYLFVDAVVRAGLVALRWMPPALLIVWMLWLLLIHSSVRLEPGRLVIRNAARTHEIPWAHVAAILPGPQLYVETTEARRIACLGAPFPRRPGRSRPGSDQRTDPQDEFIDALDTARAGGSSSAAPVVSRWEPIPLAAGAVLLLATVVVFTVVP